MVGGYCHVDMVDSDMWAEHEAAWRAASDGFGTIYVMIMEEPGSLTWVQVIESLFINAYGLSCVRFSRHLIDIVYTYLLFPTSNECTTCHVPLETALPCRNSQTLQVST